jgi:hypothetical protein
MTETDMFDGCETLDEVLTCASIALTRDQLELLLVDVPCRMLRAAQNNLERAGMTDLASICASHAKTAKRGTLSFAE